MLLVSRHRCFHWVVRYSYTKPIIARSHVNILDLLNALVIPTTTTVSVRFYPLPNIRQYVDYITSKLENYFTGVGHAITEIALPGFAMEDVILILAGWRADSLMLPQSVPLRPDFMIGSRSIGMGMLGTSMAVLLFSVVSPLST